MNLKEIIAKIAGLEQRAEAAFKAELETVKSAVNGTIAQLQADLATATAAIASLTTGKADLEANLQELTGKLSEANKLETDLKTAVRVHLALLPGHADYKDGGSKAGANLAELIAAEMNATNTAIAATGVKLEALPGAGGSPANTGSKTMTRQEFEALPHAERSAFFRHGGKLKE